MDCFVFSRSGNRCFCRCNCSHCFQRQSSLVVACLYHCGYILYIYIYIYVCVYICILGVYLLLRLICLYILGLLDISAAFDTVDYDTLLKCLETSYGIVGTPLRSSITDRERSEKFSLSKSTNIHLTREVTRGPSLDPHSSYFTPRTLLPSSNVMDCSTTAKLMTCRCTFVVALTN